jgi:hypothetical protein
VRVVLCHDDAECGTAAVHAAAAAAAAVSATAAAISAAVLASVVVATAVPQSCTAFTATAYFHPLGGQQQQYPQQQWYPQQQRYPQQQQFDQLHQQYQQPPLPSQQCPTPAIYTSTSHTQYPRHALSADISLAPTYLSADATALRTIDETVPMSPEAAAVTQPEGAADILESDLYSILEKYVRNTSELKPGSPAFERRIDAAVASTSGTTFPQTARCDQHLVICSVLSTLNSRTLWALNSVLSHCALIVHCASSSRLCALALSALSTLCSRHCALALY